MKFAFFDEAGVGDPRVEKAIVVAGVIVDADTQYKIAESELARIRNELIPAAERPGFVFHAKDLFHGSGAFPRERFSKDVRWRALENICRIPSRLGLRPIFHFVQRDKLREKFPTASEPEIVELGHLSCFARSIAGVEKYMQTLSGQELAMIVYENTDSMRSKIRKVFINLMYSNFLQTIGEPPLRRVVETPLFSNKNESCLLQLADTGAFAISRCFRGTSDCDRFYKAFTAGIPPEKLPNLF